MAEFNEDSFHALAKLSRIECSEEEKKKLLANVNKMLSYVEQLSEVDVKGVKPCETVLENMGNVMREDTPSDPLLRDTFLANAPSHIGGMIRVPPVIKF